MSDEKPPTWTQRLLLFLAINAGYLALRLLYATWRVRFEQKEAYLARKRAGETFIGAYWHNRILLGVGLWRGWSHYHVLMSRHRDGEIIARLAQKFGFGAVRGSSSRGGSEALKELVETAGREDVGITPDGPRGPRYVAAPGLTSLVRTTGKPLVLMSLSADRYWRLASWDEFYIGKPFARVACKIEIIERLDPSESFEESHARVQDGLLRVQGALDREVGGEAAVDPELRGEPAPAHLAPEARKRAREARKAARGRPVRTALVLAALAFAALAALPFALGAGGERNPRADVCATLLAACALAGAAAPALAGRKAAGLGLVLGAALAAVVAALPGGAGLALKAAAGAAYPALLLVAAAALGGVWRAAPAAFFLGSIFLFGPLLSRLDRPGDAFAWLLRGSAVTALSGSLLDIDLLRSAPLYRLVPAVSETPFAYPGYAAALALPATAALVSLAFCTLRRGNDLRPRARVDNPTATR